MAFSLLLTSPLLPPAVPGRIMGTDLNADVTGLVYSTALPGGYENLEVTLQRNMRSSGLEYADLENPGDVQHFAHVQLWVGAFRAFEGRIVRINRAGGQVGGFGVQGYGLAALTDDVLTNRDTTPRTAGSLLSAAIAASAPLLRIGSVFVDTQVSHTANEFVGAAPADMMNQFLSEGGNNGSQWDYYVYEDRLVNFVPRQAPAVPDYLIPFDERVTWDEDASTMTGAVIVNYTPLDGSTGTTGRIGNSGFLSQFGFNRTSPVQGGNLRDDGAAAYAQTYLTLNSVPKYQIGITRERMRGFETPGGIDIPPWEIRSGQWVQIGRQAFLPIIRTQYDVFAGTLQAEVGQPIPSVANLVQQLQRVSGHVVRGSNPNTGART